MILAQRNVSHVKNDNEKKSSKMFCSKCMRVTPPLPLRTSYHTILALRTAYRYFLAFHTAYCLTTKYRHFGRFHLHQEDKITVCCMHMYAQLFLKTLSTVFFACLDN